jgi:hypothetical protein
VKRLLLASVGIFAVIGLSAAPAQAKKKKKPAPVATVKQSADTNVLPPGDKRTNEGAQGRINATEDAAQQADSPQFDHRP